MYHRRVEFNVVPGGIRVFEEAMTTLGELRKTQKGYVGESLLHSYGFPARFATTIRWESWEAANAFARSKAFEDFVKANTGQGAFTPSRPTEAYESVLDVGVAGVAPEDTMCEVLADWVIDRGPAGAAAFESRFAELGELRKKHMQGFASSRLRRSLGNPFRYLAIHICKDLESASKAWEAAPLQKFASDHPISEVTGVAPVVDTYRVVQRMTA